MEGLATVTTAVSRPSLYVRLSANVGVRGVGMRGGGVRGVRMKGSGVRGVGVRGVRVMGVGMRGVAAAA